MAGALPKHESPFLIHLPFAQTLLCWALLDANGLPSGGGEASAAEAHGPGWRALGLKLAVPAGLLVLVSIVFSNVVLFNLIGDRILYGSLGFVFWADALCLIATYILLLPEVLRRGVREEGPGVQVAGWPDKPDEATLRAAGSQPERD